MQDLNPLRWTWHPSTVIGVLLLAAWYVAECRRQARWTGWQRGAFAAGLTLLLLSLNGPLHDLSERFLFSAHMVQHLVLMLAIPPLLLVALPPGVADRLAAVGGAVARVVTRPLPAFLVPTMILGVWHFPAPYDASLADHPVHIVMHLSFLVAGTLLWWPVLSPSRRLPPLAHGPRMIYLFGLAFPMTLMGSLIALADHPLYAAYIAAPRVWAALTPLEDQRVGGLIMWVSMMPVLVAGFGIIWFRWARDESAESY